MPAVPNIRAVTAAAANLLLKGNLNNPRGSGRKTQYAPVHE
jgi:hypothetical protein